MGNLWKDLSICGRIGGGRVGIMGGSVGDL